MTPALPPLEIAARIDRLRPGLAAVEVAGLIVTEPANIRYLCGFTGSNGVLYVGANDAVLITDGRYATQAPEQIDDSGAQVVVRITNDDRTELDPLVRAAGQVGLEAGAITWAGQQRYADAFDGVGLVATSGLVESLRSIKDEGEIARMRRAASIADDALAEVRATLTAGMPEREVSLALNTTMQRLGATGPAFETIVASGPNSAKPHARPSSRPIGCDELIVTDFGALVDGYRSDMTRMTVLGEPDAEQVRLLDAVRAAQAAGVAAVRPGATCAEIDAACRDLLRDAGLGDAFMHGTGHGVGLDIHEAPSVNARTSDTLLPGHVITVEPGVYLPDVGGVRIEDTLVVTADGCQPLTMFPKDPVGIG